MQKIAVVNLKGGVGKSTVAVNMAAVWAAEGIKTVIVDCDSQGTASYWLNARDEENNFYHAMVKGKVMLPIVEVGRNLSIVPATEMLNNCEYELVTKVGREFKLKALLDGISKRYDVCLLDCKPSPGIMSINALVAADSFLIAVKPEFDSLRGIINLLETVDAVKAVNPRLKLAGVVATNVNMRRILDNNTLNEIKANYRLFEPYIRTDISIPESFAAQMPVTEYNRSCHASLDFSELSQNILKYLNI